MNTRRWTTRTPPSSRVGGSELITHLAFYSGWGNAMSAAVAAKDVFTRRKIGADQFPPSSPPLLPLDRAAEEKRAATVEQQ